MIYKFLLLFFISATYSLAHGQFSSYSFENNLNDSISDVNGVFLENGIEITDPATYISGPTGQSVLFSPLDGLKFPLSLNSQIDTDSSLELEFDFTVTDIGDGAGYMALINNQNGLNNSGFTVFVRHDVFSQNEDYEVVFSYADGGFNQGVPNHPGHEETRIGFFNEGDLVQLRLIIDFENKQWFSLLNEVYTSASIDDYYDYSLIKQSFVEKQIYMSWYRLMERDIPFTTDFFTSTARFDNLKLYSPRQPSNLNDFTTAVQAMTAHVNGTQPLSSSQLNVFLADAQLNFNLDFNSIQQDVFNYINAYENAYEPIFNNRQVVSISSLAAESQLLILLQQHIHDQLFNPSNITNMAGIKFEFAELFPGIVDQNAPTVINASVEINGTHKILKAARVVDDLVHAKRPTGYFVPAGELVSITIPADLINQGLSAMVGAHDSDHSSLSETNRFVRMTKNFPLNSITTQVANPFGGGLYIRIPVDLDIGWFTIQINGAVKSPYFSYRTDRVTPLIEWQDQLSDANVPWVDIESDKYMMTLPLNHVESLLDPTSLMQQWNDIQDGFNFVGGRPPERARAEYFLIDSRLPSNGFGIGYPQVIGDRLAPLGNLNATALYPTQVLNPGFHDSSFFITLHEMGHGVLHPTLGTEVETNINVNAVYIYNILYNLSLDDAFKFSSGESHSTDETTIDWMIADNFRNNQSMDCDPTMGVFVCDELRYQHRGHVKYKEMVDIFGWDAMYEMNKFFYDIWNNDETGVQLTPTPDLVIRAASEATGYNMAPLMHFWGLQPSNALMVELSDMPESDAILTRLYQYKDLVPTNQQDFQPWYDINYPKKDPVHYPRYDAALANYDTEQYGQAMQNQIDSIIDLYFIGLPDLIMKNGFEAITN